LRLAFAISRQREDFPFCAFGADKKLYAGSDNKISRKFRGKFSSNIAADAGFLINFNRYARRQTTETGGALLLQELSDIFQRLDWYDRGGAGVPDAVKVTPDLLEARVYLSLSR